MARKIWNIAEKNLIIFPYTVLYTDQTGVGIKIRVMKNRI